MGAVVLGGDYQGLGVVRSLGRHGVPVCVVDDEHSISRFSKYTTKVATVLDVRDEHSLVTSLKELCQKLGLEGWVLYPTRDEQVAAFSRNRSELSRFFRVPTPDWESVQWAWDKRNTYRRASELGIPIPRTLYPQDVEQLAELDSVSPPFAIKPAIKEHFIYATKAKAWCANTHGELRTLFQKASELVGPGEVMVQEVIPGGGAQQFSYCAFFRDGEAVGSMTARRRRQHPLQFGRASTYVEAVDAPVIEELSKQFLRAINYYGLVEVEYKLDPRDNQYKLLDVNARTWGYHSIGRNVGVDFSYMLYSDQVGIPVTPSRAIPGASWVRMTTDIPAALMAYLGKDLDLSTYVRSLRNCSVDAVFSREDPMPGLAEILLVPYLALKRGF
ncbi:MAG: ATP-grasp domain-containing protein [Acidobacteriia bacterium]|nr:ATP-grasp domain-containing protein [Terriglobia bacterium]